MFIFLIKICLCVREIIENESIRQKETQDSSSDNDIAHWQGKARCKLCVSLIWLIGQD